MLLATYCLLVVACTDDINPSSAANGQNEFCPYKCAPAAQPVIVIDPGHGGRDHGAARDGISEKDVTLAVARQLADELRLRCGNKLAVRLTRNNDSFVDLSQRAAMAANDSAALFISLHCNSLETVPEGGSDIEGAVIFVAPPHLPAISSGDAMEQSIAFNRLRSHRLNATRLAQTIGQHLTHVAARSSAHVRQEQLMVLSMATVPAVLVELDYLTNATQAKFLASRHGQLMLANAICDAIIEYSLNNGLLSTLD